MMGTLRSAHLAGAVLIGAGIYQWTPAKDACLGECRTPGSFLARHFRTGDASARIAEIVLAARPRDGASGAGASHG